MLFKVWRQLRHRWFGSLSFTKVGQIVVENTDEEKIFDISVSNGAEEVEKGDENNLIISVEAEEFHNLKMSSRNSRSRFINMS